VLFTTGKERIIGDVTVRKAFPFGKALSFCKYKKVPNLYAARVGSIISSSFYLNVYKCPYING
jgi:hypothetical protein